jgi:hypothetical protein
MVGASNCQETWSDLVMPKDKISQACSPEGTGFNPGAVMTPEKVICKSFFCMPTNKQ